MWRSMQAIVGSTLASRVRTLFKTISGFGRAREPLFARGSVSAEGHRRESDNKGGPRQEWRQPRLVHRAHSPIPHHFRAFLAILDLASVSVD